MREKRLFSFTLRGFADNIDRRCHKAGTHAFEFMVWNGVMGAVLQYALVFGLHFVEINLPLGFDQNLDARFVDVVATAPCVVDAHNGFQVIDDLVPG